MGNALKYADFKRKRLATKHSKGHKHWRSPSKLLWRCVRGMVPHKTTRGALAMDRLKTFEGIPSPYDEKKRVVIPAALKCLRLKNHRKYARLGDLSKMYGWKSTEIVKTLEAKRKVKSEEFYKARRPSLPRRPRLRRPWRATLRRRSGRTWRSASRSACSEVASRFPDGEIVG